MARWAPPKLVAKTENQKRYITAIQSFKLIFGLGPAGTGNTHIATSLAAEWLASNCVVLLDEAQNVTKKQMKMFLTRIGEGCTVIVDGDAAQVDIPDSGLVDAVKRLQHIPAVKIIQFSRQDIVRDDIVAEILEAYDQ